MISGNIVTNCRNYGIFTEKQGSGSLYYSRGLLITAPAVEGPRPTDDVDVIIEVTGLAGYHRIVRELRERGHDKEPREQGHVRPDDGEDWEREGQGEEESVVAEVQGDPHDDRHAGRPAAGFGRALGSVARAGANGMGAR